MQVIKSEVVGAPERVVEFKLPVDRANALADAIDKGIIWANTEVEVELSELYDALKGF